MPLLGNIFMTSWWESGKKLYLCIRVTKNNMTNKIYMKFATKYHLLVKYKKVAKLPLGCIVTTLISLIAKGKI